MKALITGASSGIGEEFAYIFAQNRYDLVLVARSKDELLRVAKACREFGVSVQIIVKDLTSEGAVAYVTNKAGAVDVLVNNAGFGAYGAFTETDWNKEESMIQLNITALTQLSKHYAKTMKNGKILHVASTAAFFPGPYMSVYYASKAYVLSFSLALSQELDKVSVTCLCPGPTKTGFAKAADAQKLSIFKSAPSSARRVAQNGFTALMRGRRMVVSGFRNKVAVFLSRLLPRSLQARIVARITN